MIRLFHPAEQLRVDFLLSADLNKIEGAVGRHFKRFPKSITLDWTRQTEIHANPVFHGPDRAKGIIAYQVNAAGQGLDLDRADGALNACLQV